MDRPDPLRWWVLGVLVLAALPVALDPALLVVAVPQLAAGRAGTAAAVLVAQAAPLGLGLPVGAALVRRRGPRGVLLSGLVLLTAAAAGAAVTVGALGLLVARALMGVAGALVLPAALAALERAFADAERGRAVAVWAAGTGLFVALGPLLAGVLTSAGGGHAVLGLQAALALLALVGCRLRVAAGPGPGRHLGARRPLTAVELPGALAAGVVGGLTLAVSWELQGAGGRTPVATGLILLPAALSVLAGPPAGLLARRWGRHRSTAAGLTLMSLAAAGFTTVGPRTHGAVTAVLLVLLALGASGATTASLAGSGASRATGSARLLGAAGGVTVAGVIVAAAPPGLYLAGLVAAGTAAVGALLLFVRGLTGRGAAAPARRPSVPRARSTAR